MQTSSYGCAYCGSTHSEWETCRTKQWYSSVNSNSATYYTNPPQWSSVNTQVQASFVPPEEPEQEDDDLQWLHDEVDRFVEAGAL